MQSLQPLRDNIARCFFGNPKAVDRIITCLIAQGHLLIEDVPGVGKTMLASALAKSIDGSIARIQLTPDMLPADILGVTIFDQHKTEFNFKPGPIFANIVLADEINRTTPRTQSALLEVMSESQISIDGTTHHLPPPFCVIATQNPYEFEGTYFLPESQLDRFLMRISLGYPSPEDEAQVLTRDPSRTELKSLKPVMSIQTIIELQQQAQNITIDQTLIDYIVAIANASRTNDQIQIGVSTRGSLALIHAAKATALLNSRDYVTPDDIADNIIPVLAHRITPKNYIHDTGGITSQRIMQQIIESVAAPV
ncbi:ATPase family associated with various cellular activities (AAA) [Poriferisphaera corsica]|uniref:ATPase family associated with various cellular activities (AAA) n=1 Tax=Poriferisphaera corsica TaxID=2528020 RepID=A0A517YU90_9BACT|nr:MoxR family ATPase [Poriferisphaera corsica]QDU33732.1 ATPase family associated with various cellular activities (AAA) [Poriferisphaera corsica]